jgi:hypothetical protein
MGDFFDQLQKVWPLVMSAPWGFAPLFALLLFAGWVAGRFAFGERIANLKSRLESRDEKIATLEARLLEQNKSPAKPQIASRPSPPPPVPPQISKPVSAQVGKKSVREILLAKRWLFHFSPGGNGGKKPITFLPDGTIGEGRNSNEYGWRIEGVEGDRLTIYRANGDVQNIFQYSYKSGNFDFMPDNRSVGFKAQFIEPR